MPPEIALGQVLLVLEVGSPASHDLTLDGKVLKLLQRRLKEREG